MIQLLCASTLFGAATIAAALDAGLLPGGDRRILVVESNVAIPELATDLHAAPAFGAIEDRFDEIVRWNDVVHPYHPKEWQPRREDLALWQRQLREYWQLGSEPVQVVAESIATAPSASIIRIFESAPVIAYADGLMSYGPTRETLPAEVGGRISQLLHLDLVPGLRPVLLSEWQVPPVVVPNDAFRRVVEAMAQLDPPEKHGFELPPAGSYALLLGQYLSAINLLSAEEERDQHQRMVQAAVDRGYRRIVMKAHPSAPREDQSALRAYAASLGATLEHAPAAVLAESLLSASAPGLVVGCFSTAMITAATVYGCPIAGVGATEVLDRLRPYWNSNRIPIMIIDAITRPDSPYTDLAALQALVDANSYCMQPKRLPHLRSRAEQVFAGMSDAELRRYPKRRRLTDLDLPGALPRRRRLGGSAAKTKPRGVRRIVKGVRRRLRKAGRRLAPMIDSRS